MKSISLYVDKWYVVGAINIDGVPHPISLPNGEDRFWLYFFEDVANNRVLYGKIYEQSYRDKKPHYYGDVFSLLKDNKRHFVRFDNRPEELKEIFNASGMFDHLHQAAEVSADQDIDVYVSFSTDINYISRKYFIDEMNEHHLLVKESVAWISHLALEECHKKGKINEEGFYLVMTATNENLHYSVYEYANGLFLRKAAASLEGGGLDIRRRALIESVVDNINRTTKFLSTPDEFTQEYLRMERFADEWLAKVVQYKRRPFSLSNVTLAIAPNNPYEVPVFPNKLNERTSVLVNDIIRKVESFIKEIPLALCSIKGLILLGNTFTNEQYLHAINAKVVLPADAIMIYKDNDLSHIVAMYAFMDCSQFSSENKQFEINAEQEAERIRIAQAEEDAAIKAKAEAEALSAENERVRKAEREYRNAMDNVNQYERERDYEQMLDWAKIALAQRPNDELANEKIQQAQQLIADERAKAKQYSDVMQRVKTCMDERRWVEVISQCEVALGCRPDSQEARRLLDEAKRRLEVSENVKDFMNRAELFFAQKFYDEAEQELAKVRSLDPTNSEAVKRQKDIQAIRLAHQHEINSLVDAAQSFSSNSDYKKAMDLYDKLVNLDKRNSRKWTEMVERMKQKDIEEEKKKSKLLDLKRRIDSYFFEEDWTSVIQNCEAYLSIDENADIRDFLGKAKSKMDDMMRKKNLVEGINRIKALMSDDRLNDAEQELDRLRHKYPQEKDLFKDLAKRIFNALAAPIQIEKKESKPIGFPSPISKDSKEEFDFFGNDKRENNKTKIERKPMKKQNDEFFNRVPLRKDNNVDGNTSASIRNDDFNF
jgi:tetratricopeptide (TPR) repeat protein